MTDPLEILHDALIRNAEGFRKRGHHGCADRSEEIATKLRKAIEEAK